MVYVDCPYLGKHGKLHHLAKVAYLLAFYCYLLAVVLVDCGKHFGAVDVGQIEKF